MNKLDKKYDSGFPRKVDKGKHFGRPYIIMEKLDQNLLVYLQQQDQNSNKCFENTILIGIQVV